MLFSLSNFSFVSGSRAMSDLDDLYEEIKDPSQPKGAEFGPLEDVQFFGVEPLGPGGASEVSSRHPSAFGSWVNDPNIVSQRR